MIGNERELTAQEQFWVGDFGTEYSARNTGGRLLASNLQFFCSALDRAGPIESCLEFGANIGMNLRALRLLYPDLEVAAVEINEDAAAELGRLIGPERVFTGSMFDYEVGDAVDLSIAKTVLIHIDPQMLELAYRRLYDSSRQYILVCEYYNRTPVSIPYRGHSDRLFKRDFAGEMLDLFPDLILRDYGFHYHRDPSFPQDDITWFLMEKDH